LLQGGQRPGAKAFMAGLQLFEDVEPRTGFRLSLQGVVLLLGGHVQFVLDFAQTPLPLLDRAARGLGV
jgi:hypothetical protein